MRWLTASVLLMCVAAASFAAGAKWQLKRLDDQAREVPCVVRYWNPNMGAFVQTNVDDRDCLKLQQSKRFRGVWTDAPVGSDFISPDASLPEDTQLSFSPYIRAQLYRKAGVATNLGSPTKLRFEIDIVGRLARYPTSSRVLFLDSSPNKIVVDKVLAARPI